MKSQQKQTTKKFTIKINKICLPVVLTTKTTKTTRIEIKLRENLQFPAKENDDNVTIIRRNIHTNLPYSYIHAVCT